MTPEFDFKDVHRQCPICFIDRCPSRETCLRYFAAQQAPQNLTAHLCVTPQALQGDRCPLYKEKRTVRVAYGFKQSFDTILGKDLPRIRQELMEYFGYNRSYYEHLRGQRPLMPDEQKGVGAIFERNGYPEAVRYDRIENVFVLETIPY